MFSFKPDLTKESGLETVVVSNFLESEQVLIHVTPPVYGCPGTGNTTVPIRNLTSPQTAKITCS
jgi:hypothetical protein